MENSKSKNGINVKKSKELKNIPFPFYKQHDSMDCGATCLRMIAKYYGKSYSLETLRQKTYITREGVSLLGISEAAEFENFNYFLQNPPKIGTVIFKRNAFYGCF
jgi:predicted double-glycine peptidase